MKQVLRGTTEGAEVIQFIQRRLQEDLIEVFKIFHGFDNINVNDHITNDLTSTTRSNGFKIIGKRFRSNEAKHFFFNRIVNV